jgi:hypothetical protein
MACTARVSAHTRRSAHGRTRAHTRACENRAHGAHLRLRLRGTLLRKRLSDQRQCPCVVCITNSIHNVGNARAPPWCDNRGVLGIVVSMFLARVMASFSLFDPKQALTRPGARTPRVGGTSHVQYRAGHKRYTPRCAWNVFRRHRALKNCLPAFPGLLDNRIPARTRMAWE